MLEWTKRISFRIPSVLSKVEPEPEPGAEAGPSSSCGSATLIMVELMSLLPVENAPGLLLIGAVEHMEGHRLHSGHKGGDVLITQTLLRGYTARPLPVVTLHVHPAHTLQLFLTRQGHFQLGCSMCTVPCTYITTLLSFNAARPLPVVTLHVHPAHTLQLLTRHKYRYFRLWRSTCTRHMHSNSFNAARPFSVVTLHLHSAHSAKKGLK